MEAAAAAVLETGLDLVKATIQCTEGGDENILHADMQVWETIETCKRAHGLQA
jgi:hypothetical protein